MEINAYYNKQINLSSPISQEGRKIANKPQKGEAEKIAKFRTEIIKYQK